jgi:hypothetical protein
MNQVGSNYLARINPPKRKKAIPNSSDRHTPFVG